MKTINDLIENLSAAFKAVARRKKAPHHVIVPPKKYYKDLDRKKSSAVALIFKDGKILLQENTYDKFLGFPGGMLNENEGPKEAARRECHEEMGVNVEIKELLCVDYYQNHGDKLRGDGMHFIFLGDIGNQQPMPDGDEIKSFLWLTPEEAFLRLDEEHKKELKAALMAIREGRAIYCEEALPALPSSSRRSPPRFAA